MKYRKKPVEIEAIQATKEQIWKWILKEEPYPKNTRLSSASYHEEDRRLSFFTGTVVTLEGDMRFDIDDWIITGVKGETYPCKPDIFEMTYEPVTDAVASEGLGVEEIEFCMLRNRMPQDDSGFIVLSKKGYEKHLEELAKQSTKPKPSTRKRRLITMKSKRCKHWIVINEPDCKDAFCVGGHGYTVYEDCRGYWKKECGWYEERESLNWKKEKKPQGESYPAGWTHCTIHLNKEKGIMHSDGDHSVRGWIEERLKELADLKKAIDVMKTAEHNTIVQLNDQVQTLKKAEQLTDNYHAGYHRGKENGKREALKAVASEGLGVEDPQKWLLDNNLGDLILSGNKDEKVYASDALRAYHEAQTKYKKEKGEI